LTIERVWERGSQINLRGRLGRGAHEQRQLHSKISFIDLAGSERAAFTQNVGQALKDGARINQSLLALANCIDALIVQSRLTSSTPRKKPPYRDSKLTLLLKGSLMGDGLVAMIANVHPGRLHFEDSNNTLEYAKRASTVKATNRRMSKVGLGNIDEIPSAAPNISDELVSTARHCEAGDVQVVQHGEGHDAEPTHPSSSIPKPRKTRAATLSTAFLPTPQRTRVAQPKSSRQDDESTPTCEVATVSSPEKCLSEISLSPLQDPEGEIEAASSNMCLPSSFDARSSHVPEGAADSEDGHKACWEQSEQPPAELDVGIEHCESEKAGRRLPEQRVATELVAKLQQDAQRIDARLRSVTRERNALLQDRQVLEDDNERLREENMEKDRQLLILLGRCNLASA